MHSSTIRTVAELNQLIEPNDVTAGALLELMSPAELLSLINTPDHVPLGLKDRLYSVTGQRPAADSAQDLKVSLNRWRKRLGYSDASAALETVQRLGGGLISWEDDCWPKQLDDLRFARPLCLWWRSSDPHRLGRTPKSKAISIVGSRDASDYGNQVTFELGRALSLRGLCLVSGGAYGIDAAVHCAALAEESVDPLEPPTIAFLAGGADKLYPAGNSTLLQQVMNRGLLFSEVPPGTTPTRFRFLNRNRLIAAFSTLTIVTEARYRSGALNTASHAVELGREVAAVPGSVFSPNSAGTHRMIRSGSAELISSPADVFDMLGLPADGQLPISEPEDPRSRPTDQLPADARLVFDILSFTRPMTADEACSKSGVPMLATIKALGLMQRLSLAEESDAGWKLLRG